MVVAPPDPGGLRGGGLRAGHCLAAGWLAPQVLRAGLTGMAGALAHTVTTVTGRPAGVLPPRPPSRTPAPPAPPPASSSRGSRDHPAAQHRRPVGRARPPSRPPSGPWRPGSTASASSTARGCSPTASSRPSGSSAATRRGVRRALRRQSGPAPSRHRGRRPPHARTAPPATGLHRRGAGGELGPQRGPAAALAARVHARACGAAAGTDVPPTARRSPAAGARRRVGPPHDRAPPRAALGGVMVDAGVDAAVVARAVAARPGRTIRDATVWLFLRATVTSSDAEAVVAADPLLGSCAMRLVAAPEWYGVDGRRAWPRSARVAESHDYSPARNRRRPPRSPDRMPTPSCGTGSSSPATPTGSPRGSAAGRARRGRVVLAGAAPGDARHGSPDSLGALRAACGTRRSQR